jgi:hypothetical protein
VAAFDSAGNQVSAARYSAEVELADDFYAALQHSLIDSLASTVGNDLALAGVLAGAVFNYAMTIAFTWGSPRRG